ncbi:hypothetical protein SFUMM280S_03393 [Streptomyces fumanus]
MYFSTASSRPITPRATPAQETDLIHGACGWPGRAERGPGQHDDADDRRDQREDAAPQGGGVPGVAVPLVDHGGNVRGRGGLQLAEQRLPGGGDGADPTAGQRHDAEPGGDDGPGALPDPGGRPARSAPRPSRRPWPPVPAPPRPCRRRPCSPPPCPRRPSSRPRSRPLFPFPCLAPYGRSLRGPLMIVVSGAGRGPRAIPARGRRVAILPHRHGTGSSAGGRPRRVIPSRRAAFTLGVFAEEATAPRGASRVRRTPSRSGRGCR